MVCFLLLLFYYWNPNFQFTDLISELLGGDSKRLITSRTFNVNEVIYTETISPFVVDHKFHINYFPLAFLSLGIAVISILFSEYGNKTILMKKKSKIILMMSGLTALVILGLYASHMHQNIMVKPSMNQRYIEIVDDDEFEKELMLSYDYIHVSNPSISIDGGYEDKLTISGYIITENMVSIDVCNDTLYIDYSHDYIPKYVGSNAVVAVKVHVGGVNLKSITIADEGSLKTPIKPLGMKDDREVVFSQSYLKKYMLQVDSLTIVNGPAKLFIDGDYLQI